MAINIKNEEVCELVRQASHLSGLPQVSVIEEALRAHLERLQKDSRRARVNDILAELDELKPLVDSFVADDLYDDVLGLPQ